MVQQLTASQLSILLILDVVPTSNLTIRKGHIVLMFPSKEIENKVRDNDVLLAILNKYTRIIGVYKYTHAYVVGVYKLSTQYVQGLFTRTCLIGHFDSNAIPVWTIAPALHKGHEKQLKELKIKYALGAHTVKK